MTHKLFLVRNLKLSNINESIIFFIPKYFLLAVAKLNFLYNFPESYQYSALIVFCFFIDTMCYLYFNRDNFFPIFCYHAKLLSIDQWVDMINVPTEQNLLFSRIKPFFTSISVSVGKILKLKIEWLTIVIWLMIQASLTCLRPWYVPFCTRN